jgi:hypothetical protein
VPQREDTSIARSEFTDSDDFTNPGIAQIGANLIGCRICLNTTKSTDISVLTSKLTHNAMFVKYPPFEEEEKA